MLSQLLCGITAIVATLAAVTLVFAVSQFIFWLIDR